MSLRKFSKPLLRDYVLVYIFIVVVLLGIAFPLYWMISTSFKPESEYLASPPVLIPRTPTLKAYKEVYVNTLFPAITNSLIIASVSTIIAMIIGTLAAYGFARFQWKGNKHILFWVISTRMFPPIVTAIPLFIVFKSLRLIDTHLGMIFLHTMFNLPIIMIVMYGFFKKLPPELEEAVLIDGGSQFTTFLKMGIPLSTPGLVAATILSFIFSWNEFFFALVFTRNIARTLPPALAGLHQTWGIAWGQIMAFSLIISVPVIALSLAIQRQLVSGLTLGAIK